MEHIGPYQMFSPIHLTYLQRCAASGLSTVSADLDLIEREHPAALAGKLRPSPRVMERRKALVDATCRRLLMHLGEYDVNFNWA